MTKNNQRPLRVCILSLLVMMHIISCGSGNSGNESYNINIEETVSGDYRYTEIELTLSGGGSTRPKSINDNGDIIGVGTHPAPSSCGCGSSLLKGFLYGGGIYTELQPPGWEYVGGVFAINEKGEVVGEGIVLDHYFNGKPSYTTKGFLYSGGLYTEIIPPGWESSSAQDINNKGDIVGTGDNKGFLYSDREYIEIIPPGWEYVGNISINNNGDIAGSGFDSNYTRKGGSRLSF